MDLKDNQTISVSEIEINKRIHEKFTPVTHADKGESISIDTQSTIKRQGQNKKKRKKVNKKRYTGPDPRRFKILFVVGTIIFIGLLLRFAPIAFGTLKVEGNTTITVESLIQTGLVSKPINVLQINDNKIKDALVNDLRVSSVNLNYQFPATMILNIKKREPIAVVISRFGYAEIDNNGQYISVESSISGQQVPIISGLQLGNILLGEKVKDQRVKDGLKYLVALGINGRKEISEVNVGDDNEIIAYTDNGIRIKIGKADHLEEKADLTKKMLKDIEQQNISVTTMDVNLDAPYVK